MKDRICFGIAIVMLAISFNTASAQVSGIPHYTHAELRKMIQDAHTEQQYKVLASYYRSKQQAFEQKAQAERVEWIQRGQNEAGYAAKYPRPVDSSRNRYEYLTYEATQMSEKAEHYERLTARER